MANFSTELDRAYVKKAKELGRPLTTEESTKLEGILFESWINEGRIDELIRTVLNRYGSDGGLTDIIILGHHLRVTKDEARIHSFFGSLLSRRVKAFYQWWPRARDGHLGCMQASAKASGEAFDIYIEYYHSLHALGLADECEALRKEMLRFQNRESIKSILPKSRPTIANSLTNIGTISRPLHQ